MSGNGAGIRSIFVSPAFAFARLGGSSTPQHAFEWIDTRDPRWDGETSIAPMWTLAVQPDGSVQPFLPDAVTFRDNELIRPVAPFFEIWARLGASGSDPATWQDVPLTPALLETNGFALAGLRLHVTARNLKAARRTGDPALGFGTLNPVEILGNEHAPRSLDGESPMDALVPMIPRNRRIPLGSVQMLRSMPQLADQPWSAVVNREIIRFRFTPAAGLFYGPPDAAQAQPTLGRPAPAVRAANAFLDPNAGWRGARTNVFVSPGDTYDLINQGGDTRGPSLGVVDDTCEVHFDVSLQRDGGVAALTAKAVACVGPPHFAPDRRPFLSVADELNDRTADAQARNDALSDADLDRWVEDLFERVYETVSLFNVDLYRRDRAATLPPDRLGPNDVDNGERADPTQAMGGRDLLRNPLYKLPAPTPIDPLPLSQHARMRHRALSDLQNLIDLVARDPQRIGGLVRAPFESEAFETPNTSSMRMPPFMRQSNASALTLAAWQHDLLMRWVARTAARTAGPLPTALSINKPLSPGAAARRAEVLARLDAAEGQ